MIKSIYEIIFSGKQKENHQTSIFDFLVNICRKIAQKKNKTRVNTRSMYFFFKVIIREKENVRDHPTTHPYPQSKD
jgi:hypothetical protein